MNGTEPAPPSVLVALASDAAAAFEPASATLMAQGPRAVPLLLAGLADARLGLMAHARILRLLGAMGRVDTLPAMRGALRQALDAGDPIVASAAMEAMASLRNDAALAELVALFDHPGPRIAAQAAVLAGFTGLPAALAPLQALLGSADARLRYAAAVGLLRLEDARARNLLGAHLANETDAEVRALIAAAGIAASP